MEKEPKVNQTITYPYSRIPLPPTQENFKYHKAEWRTFTELANVSEVVTNTSWCYPNSYNGYRSYGRKKPAQKHTMNKESIDVSF